MNAEHTKQYWIANEQGSTPNMPHAYYDSPRMSIGDDPLTETKSGDCLPGCIRVDSSRYPNRCLLRVPVAKWKGDLRDLMELVTEVCHA